MNNNSKVSIPQEVKRIGILLGDLGNLNVTALKFLVLRMNMLQHAFEYEFLDVNSEDAFLKKLSNQALVNREEIVDEADSFLNRFQKFLQEEIISYRIQESQANHLILVTLVRFDDNFYVARGRGLTIIALGNWKRSMAPPSIVEFIVTLILGESLAFLSKTLRKPTHLGTKGCIFDFTPYLGNARFQVLNGFICNYCRTVLESEGFGELVKEFAPVLDKRWLGKSLDPDSPAGITANLGYDLFITKGLKATPWENFLITMRQEGVKQFLVIVATIVIAILLLLFRLK